MGIRSVAAAVLLLGALAHGCAGGGEDTTRSDTGAATAPETGSTRAETDGLAAGCANAAAGYAVRYPSGWHTNATDDLEPCRYFHPEPFVLPERTEAVGLAISFQVADVPYDRLLESALASPAQVTESEEELTVAGRRALRVEALATGGALLREGTRVLTYYVDLDGSTLIASTTDAGRLDYERNAGVLRRMVDSLAVPRDG